MPFRFRLEAPLRVSRARRQDRRRELAEAVRALVAAEERIEQERDLVVRAASSRSTRTKEGISGQELRWLDEQLRLGFKRLQRAETSIEALAAREEAARAALAEETQRIDVLEQIRERRLAAHRHELARREQAQLDDVTLNRFSSRRGAGDGEEER